VRLIFCLFFVSAEGAAKKSASVEFLLRRLDLHPALSAAPRRRIEPFAAAWNFSACAFGEAVHVMPLVIFEDRMPARA
jgi:hypothetical protein